MLSRSFTVLLITLSSCMLISCADRQFESSSDSGTPNSSNPNDTPPPDPSGSVIPLEFNLLTVVDSETEVDFLTTSLSDAARIDMKPTSGKVKIGLKDCLENSSVKIDATNPNQTINLGSFSCADLKSAAGVTLDPPLKIASSNKKWILHAYQRTDKADIASATNSLFYDHSFKIEKIRTKINTTDSYAYAFVDYKGFSKVNYHVKINFSKSRLIQALSNSDVSATFLTEDSAAFSQIGENIVVDNTTNPDDISIVFNNVTSVYLSKFIDLRLSRSGDEFFRIQNLKYNIPVKQFRVPTTEDISGDEYYRRIYDVIYFSLNSPTFTATIPFTGEDTRTDTAFYQQQAHTSSPHYTPTYSPVILNLTDPTGFGVDYDLEIEW